MILRCHLHKGRKSWLHDNFGLIHTMTNRQSIPRQIEQFENSVSALNYLLLDVVASAGNIQSCRDRQEHWYNKMFKCTQNVSPNNVRSMWMSATATATGKATGKTQIISCACLLRNTLALTSRRNMRKMISRYNRVVSPVFPLPLSVRKFPNNTIWPPL